MTRGNRLALIALAACGGPTTPPSPGDITLVVTSPSPGDTISGAEHATIAVAGTVATTHPEFGALEAWVNGARVEVTDGSFATELAPEPGINHVKIEGSDGFGALVGQELDVLWPDYVRRSPVRPASISQRSARPRPELLRRSCSARRDLRRTRSSRRSRARRSGLIRQSASPAAAEPLHFGGGTARSTSRTSATPAEVRRREGRRRSGVGDRPTIDLNGVPRDDRRSRPERADRRGAYAADSDRALTGTRNRRSPSA
jgi:hypothetical protein